MMEWWRLLNGQNKVAVCVIATFLALVGASALQGSGWWKQRQEAKRLEEQEQHRKAMGTSATFASAFLLAAWKQCTVIGVQDIDACAKQTGPLLQEQTAASVAAEAVGQREMYLKDCRTDYDNDYCVALLTRAITFGHNSEVMSRRGGQ
jgi:hypothetical protein